MARNDLFTFEELTKYLGLNGFNLETDVIKIGFIDNTITPAIGDTTPAWGDYSANEVGTGGGYTAGGIIIPNNTYTETGGVATLDGDNISLTQDAGGFTNLYWGIIYNDTHASDLALAFLDFGGPVSEQAGPIAVNWAATGIFTLTRTV
jgi:hypothetical protein